MILDLLSLNTYKLYTSTSIRSSLTSMVFWSTTVLNFSSPLHNFRLTGFSLSIYLLLSLLSLVLIYLDGRRKRWKGEYLGSQLLWTDCGATDSSTPLRTTHTFPCLVIKAPCFLARFGVFEALQLDHNSRDL